MDLCTMFDPPGACRGSTIQTIETWLQSVLPTDGSHGIEHALSVARRVARNDACLPSGPCHNTFPQSPLHVATLAALVHDAVDKKYVANPQEHFNAYIAPFLTNLGLSDDNLRITRVVVLCMSFTLDLERGDVPPEVRDIPLWCSIYKAVADADRIDAVGATGLFRTLMFEGFKGRAMSRALDYVDKLRNTAQAVYSMDAKAEVQRRVAHMDTIMRLYRDECSPEVYAARVTCDAFG